MKSLSGITLFKNKPIICGIYCIECTVNNKKYIGQSVNIYKRLLSHYNQLKKQKHCNKYMLNTFLKYGEENFIYSILEEVKENNLTNREQYWADFYKTWDANFGFNYGECLDNPFRGKEHTEETKLLLNKIAKNREYTIERNNKISKALKGRKKTQQEINKIREGALLGHDKEKKILEIVSPEGKYLKIKGIRAFCKKNNLNHQGFNALKKNEVKQYKGYRLYKGEESLKKYIDKLAKHKNKNNKYELTDKNNQRIEIKSIEAFCKQENFSLHFFYKLIKNEIPEYKGWKNISHFSK